MVQAHGMKNRAALIADCMERIHECLRNQRAGGGVGALLGEMDWRRELHCLIWQDA